MIAKPGYIVLHQDGFFGITRARILACTAVQALLPQHLLVLNPLCYHGNGVSAGAVQIAGQLLLLLQRLLFLLRE